MCFLILIVILMNIWLKKMPKKLSQPYTKKRIKPVPPPAELKYDPSFCDIARDELAKIHSIVAIAAKLKVCRTTIYEWREKYPEFDAAIREGQKLGETRFEMLGVDNLPNKNFNAILWSMLGRKIYRVAETRTVKIPGLDKCKTYEEEVNCIRNAMAKGKITPKEASEASNIIATKAKMYELTEAKKLLEEMQATVGKNKTKK